MGKLRRVIKCIAVSPDDNSAYIGTTTGDLLRIDLNSATPGFKENVDELFSRGINTVNCVGPYLLLGNGDGTIVRLDRRTLKRPSRRLKKRPDMPKLMGQVTSFAPIVRKNGGGYGYFCGTSEANIYCCVDIENMKTELRASCHFDKINDLCFLSGESRIFVTCSNDLRVWNAEKQQELLRVQIANEVCHCVSVPNSGELILTGWSDGKIRAFKPISGELDFVINNAHPEGVTAIIVTNNNDMMISGGKGGTVRFWSMNRLKGHEMIASLKEHKARVTSLVIKKDDSECISSSADGSCIVWNVRDFVRSKAVFSNTMFKAVNYHPDESQFLTCGSDRQLAYWASVDGEKIRIVEGSGREINALDIDSLGQKLVCGGAGMNIRMFDYDDGLLVATGEGHTDAINSVKIAPNGQKIISVGSEGGIFIWRNPFPPDENLESKY